MKDRDSLKSTKLESRRTWPMTIGFPLIFCFLVFHVYPRIFYPEVSTEFLDRDYFIHSLEQEISNLGYTVDWKKISAKDLKTFEDNLHFGTNGITVPVVGRWRGTYRLPIEVLIRPLEFELVKDDKPSWIAENFTLSQDGEKAYSLSSRELWIWSVPEERWEAKLSGKGLNYIGRWAVSPDNKYLSIIVNEELIVWGLKEKKTLSNFSVDATVIAELNYSQDGNTLLVLNNDDTVYGLDLATGKRLDREATMLELADTEGSNLIINSDGTPSTKLMSEYAVFDKYFRKIANSIVGEKRRNTPVTRVGLNRLSGWSVARVGFSEELSIRSPKGERFNLNLNGRLERYFPCADRSQALIQFRQEPELQLIDLKTGKVIQILHTKAVGSAPFRS